MRKTLITMVSAAVALVAVACGGSGGGDDSANPAPRVAADTSVEISAASLKFDRSSLVLPAKTKVTVSLENEDAGVLHNISIYKKADGSGKVFAGDLFNGIGTKVYQFTSPEAGTYHFRCDAHPDMSGTVKVQ